MLCRRIDPSRRSSPGRRHRATSAAIADMPNTTSASQRRFLSTLRPVPLPQRMADSYLTKDERENVITFIMTLQESR
jgi:hypothetical protein